jgi:hypothetical protein
MAVKTIEMVREIRDKQYEAFKGLSFSEQLEFIRENSKRLRRELTTAQRSTGRHIGGVGSKGRSSGTL